MNPLQQRLFSLAKEYGEKRRRSLEISHTNLIWENDRLCISPEQTGSNLGPAELSPFACALFIPYLCLPTARSLSFTPRGRFSYYQSAADTVEEPQRQKKKKKKKKKDQN